MAREPHNFEPGGSEGRGRVAVDRVHNDVDAERWIFYFHEETRSLCLDAYYLLKRPTKRHNWRIDASYERMHGRRADRPASMCEPPLPADVRIDAINNFLRTLKVCMWEDREDKKDQTAGYMQLILGKDLK